MIGVVFTKSSGHLREGLLGEGMVEIERVKNKDGEYSFPDGETFVRFDWDSQEYERVVVVHSGQPGVNEGLVELELVLENLRQNCGGIRRELWLSYFPYGMQDEAFGVGEVNVAEGSCRKWVEYYEVEKLVVLDAHFGGKEWVERYPIECVSALEILMVEVRRDWGEGVVFVGPDHGMKRRSGIASVRKVRKDSFVSAFEESEVMSEFEGKVVCVVDDILETGGTLCGFGEECTKRGASQVVAAVTHGVLEKGMVRASGCFERVYVSNSIDLGVALPGNARVVEVGNLFGL